MAHRDDDLVPQTMLSVVGSMLKVRVVRFPWVMRFNSMPLISSSGMAYDEDSTTSSTSGLGLIVTELSPAATWLMVVFESETFRGRVDAIRGSFMLDGLLIRRTFWRSDPVGDKEDIEKPQNYQQVGQ